MYKRKPPIPWLAEMVALGYRDRLARSNVNRDGGDHNRAPVGVYVFPAASIRKN